MIADISPLNRLFLSYFSSGVWAIDIFHSVDLYDVHRKGLVLEIFFST